MVMKKVSSCSDLTQLEDNKVLNHLEDSNDRINLEDSNDLNNLEDNTDLDRTMQSFGNTQLRLAPPPPSQKPLQVRPQHRMTPPMQPLFHQSAPTPPPNPHQSIQFSEAGPAKQYVSPITLLQLSLAKKNQRGTCLYTKVLIANTMRNLVASLQRNIILSLQSSVEDL